MHTRVPPDTHTCPQTHTRAPRHTRVHTHTHTLSPHHSLLHYTPSPGVFFSAMGHRLNCARYSETNCLRWWDTFLGRWWLPLLLFLPLGDLETDVLFGGSRFDFEVDFLVWPEPLPPSFVDFPPSSLSSPIRSASSSLGDSTGWRLTPRRCSPSTGSSASSRLSVWIWVGWQLWWRTFSALRRGDSKVGVFHVYWSWYSVGVLTSPWRKPALYLSPLSSCGNKVIDCKWGGW